MTSLAVDHAESGTVKSEDVFSTRREWFYVVGLIVLLGLMYAWQLQPGISSHGDISKFQFAGPVGGTVHQTGYPVYLMLTWLAAQIPVLDSATSVTAVSAVFGIAAVVATYLALRELHVRTALAFALSLVLGVSPIFFYYAIVAEVYSAHLFFMAAVLAALLRWRRTGSDVTLAIAIVLLAMSFTNHMTMVLLVPGIIWFVWKTNAATFRRPGVWAFGLLSLALAGLSYGYLIWRATDPSAVFIEVSPQTWLDLPAILIGTGGAQLVLGPGDLDVLVGRVPSLVVDTVRYAMVMIPVAIVGFRVLWRDSVGVMLGSWIAVSAAFALLFATPDPQSFLPPIVFVLVVVGAVGSEWVVARFVSSSWVVPALLALLVGASTVYGTWFVQLQSSEEYEATTRRWYSELPEDSVLTANYSDAMAGFYLLLVEGKRADVATISDSPRSNPEASAVNRYLNGETLIVAPRSQEILPGRPVYAAGREWACQLATVGFEVEPLSDQLYRVVRLGERPSADAAEVRAVCAAPVA